MKKTRLRFRSCSILGPIGLGLVAAAAMGGCSAGGTPATSQPAGGSVASPTVEGTAEAPPSAVGTTDSDDGEQVVMPAPRVAAAERAPQLAASAAPVGAPGPPLPPEVATALAEAAVTEGDYVRRELYTWTTVKQARLLAKHRFLISRKSSFAGTTIFDLRLRRQPGSAKIADLLRSKGLEHRRFGWSNSWAARLGHDGHGFGNQLAKVRLKPNAWVARFDARLPGQWEVRDLQGKPVKVAQVVAQPWRLAAVYHVWHGDEEEDGLPSSELAFREYVLCNESMIERWELGTPVLREQLRADARWLQQLAGYFARGGSRKPASVQGYNHHADNRVWSVPARPGAQPRYEAALAFAGEPYLPTGRAVSGVANTLVADASRQVVSMAHRPVVAFGTAPPKLLVKTPASRRLCGLTVLVPCK